MGLLRIITLTSLVWALSVEAKQLHFNKVKKGDHYHLKYLWLDGNKTEKAIDFTLTKEVLFDRFRSFRLYTPEMAQENINRKLYKHLKKSPIKGITVSFKKENNISRMNVKARNNEDLNLANEKINQLKAQITNDYLEGIYYHAFTTFDGEQHVKPNHSAIAQQSVIDLKPIKPIFLEQVSVKNIRTATDYTLNFVQNIPYATLEDSATSTGKGFLPPVKLLWENKGDCDSKVTLTASLLRMLMPRSKIIFVFIDNHALIGIDLEFNSQINDDDHTITHNKVTYVLGEPTGPMQLPLGQLSDNSERAILSGHYSVEDFPVVKTPTSE